MIYFFGLIGTRIGYMKLKESIDRLNLPACIIENYGITADYHKVIRPAFDSLWNATGYSKSQFFDESGVWVGPHNQ